MGGSKIRQIVCLKQLAKHWKKMSLKSASTHHRVPSGFLAVYVERQRFLIPTRYLKLAVFVSLLNKAEEEFGYQANGGLVLPCDLHFIKQVLCFLQKDESRFGVLGFDEFVNLIASSTSSSCSKQATSTPSGGGRRQNNRTNHGGYTILSAES